AADDLDPEVGHRVAGEHAPLDRLADAGLDRRRVLGRDVGRRRAILVDVATPPIGGLDHQPDVAVVAARAARANPAADEPVLALGAPGDGLAVRDLRGADPRVDAELAAQPVDQDLEVKLAHSGDHDLAGLRIGLDPERRI